MTTTSPTLSIRRTDAKRNRDRIISAAKAAFAAPGANPSLAEISRRAGVGMATLYRNFPTRLDLLEALYAAEADAAFSAPDLNSETDPAERLRAWLREFFIFAASKRHVAAELLTHVNGDSPIFDDTKTRVIAAGRPLFDAAQRSHRIRADLTLAQVLEMLVSIAAIDGDPTYREPLLLTVLDGLTGPPG